MLSSKKRGLWCKRTMRKRSSFVTRHAGWRRTHRMWRNWTESCCDEVKFYLTKENCSLHPQCSTVSVFWNLTFTESTYWCGARKYDDTRDFVIVPNLTLQLWNMQKNDDSMEKNGVGSDNRQINLRSKHSTPRWQFDIGLSNSKRVAGQIRNLTWHLGTQHVIMSHSLVVLRLYIFRRINTQGCKILLVFNLSGLLGCIMQ